MGNGREIFESTCLKAGCLSGEVAVITGSTSNVGLGYAKALAWAGANVVIVGRNEERGNQIVKDLNNDYGENTSIFVRTDVSKQEDMKHLAEASFEKYGKVDLLLNNAMQLSLNGPILGSNIEDLDKSYAISARAVMMAANEFVPGMIERHHGVVTYSTTQFHYLPPMLGGSIYTAGKVAATSAMMSLANEVKGTGVNVFCIGPCGVGQFNPDTVKDIKFDKDAFAMPGFPGLIPAEAAGAGMVYAILHAEEMHGTGTTIGDALFAMKYPFPKPETAIPMKTRYVDGMDLTMILCSMGHGFPEE